jgi:hypothetical protein
LWRTSHTQCRLNTGARWSVSLGPHEHRCLMLIYVYVVTFCQ